MNKNIPALANHLARQIFLDGSARKKIPILKMDRHHYLNINVKSSSLSFHKRLVFAWEFLWIAIFFFTHRPSIILLPPSPRNYEQCHYYIRIQKCIIKEKKNYLEVDKSFCGLIGLVRGIRWGWMKIERDSNFFHCPQLPPMKVEKFSHIKK